MSELLLGDFSFCLNVEKRDSGKRVSGLATDSRRCKRDFIFFCKGSGFKAEYAIAAVENGACAIVCERHFYEALLPLVTDAALVLTDDILKTAAECAAFFYGYPMKRLISVAVTGTKGKTTTASLINSALNECKNIKSALLSAEVDDDAPRLTTPDAIDFHAAAARALEKKCTHIVCEISSQAQKMKRTYGIRFNYACFLNLGKDHISPTEHKDENEYYECKKSLFGCCDTAVINVDDEKGRALIYELGSSCRKITFSTFGKGDFVAENIKTDAFGCEFFVRKMSSGGGFPIVTLCGGEHNVQNSLCAAALLSDMGIKGKEILCGVLKGMPLGRGQMLVSEDKRVTVIVDYAHNEMSFRSIFKMAERSFAGAIVTAIFGCPGGKAQCRRAELSEVCSMNADKVIVCEDDSGEEGYESIKNDVKKALEGYCLSDGARLKRAFISYIENRSKAIETAIKNAYESSEKHLILILGKGDENKNRVCGCDRICEKDISVAKRVMENFDTADAVFGKAPGVVAAILDGRGACEQVAKHYNLLKEKNTQIFTVCGKKTFDILETECFYNGIAIRKISEGEIYANFKKAMNIAKSAIRSGFLPCFCIPSSEKEAVSRLCSAICTDFAVYIYESGGILSYEENAVKYLAYERAKTVNRYLQSKKLSLALQLLKSNIKEVLLIDSIGKGRLCVMNGEATPQKKTER